MLRRIFSFAVLLFAIALLSIPLAFQHRTPGVTIHESAPAVHLSAIIVNTLLPATAAAQAVRAADTTSTASAPSHGHVILFTVIAFVIVVAVVAWRFSKRGNDNYNPPSGYGSSAGLRGSGSANARST